MPRPTMFDKPVRLMTVTVTDEQFKALDEKAKLRKVTRSMLVRDLIDQFFDKLYPEISSGGTRKAK